MPLTEPLFVNIFSIYIANVFIKNLKTSVRLLKCVKSKVKITKLSLQIGQNLLKTIILPLKQILNRRSIPYFFRCFQQI